MALFGKWKKSAAVGAYALGSNMLPSDNVYTKAAMGANQTFQQHGWNVRVAAVRMLTPGELEVALVVPDNPAGLRASLEALPGPSAVLEPVEARLRFCGHPVYAQYFAETGWLEESSTPAWRYSN